MAPISVFTLKTALLTSFFMFKPSKKSEDDDKDDDKDAKHELSKKIKNEFLASQKITGLNYFNVKCIMCCC